MKQLRTLLIASIVFLSAQTINAQAKTAHVDVTEVMTKMPAVIDAQNQLKVHQLKSVLYYIKEKNTCKSKLILRYFGEIKKDDCGICSYCISKSTPQRDTISITEKIISLLKIEELNSRDIQKISKLPKDDVIFALQDLLDKDIVYIKPNNLYSLK